MSTLILLHAPILSTTPSAGGQLKVSFFYTLLVNALVMRVELNNVL